MHRRRAGIVDTDARLHTLTVYTNLSALARELELSSLETIYLLLVAPDGTILWQSEGTADEKQISALKQALEKLACGGRLRGNSETPSVWAPSSSVMAITFLELCTAAEQAPE